MDEREVVGSIEAALEQEPKVNLHGDRASVRIDFADGVVTLTGETESLAAKKLTLERAAEVPGVEGIVDRLHVRAAKAMGDGEIADHVQRAVTAEPVFDACAITRRVGEKEETVRPVDEHRGSCHIMIAVDDGIVTLDGDVPSLSHKRLAGAMAWWVPGTRDVVNGLGIEPDEEDSDDEILDALELVLERDPLVDESQIRARCADAVVTLDGLVRNDRERALAEFDAWAVFGVERVDNRIVAQPG